MFCTASTTIASGALAERMKFGAYLILSAFVCTFLYPIIGHWIWGGGWLQEMGFVDLSGSTQVHVIGGCIALVGCMMLGPRDRRYGTHGRIRIIAGHSMPLSVLGFFILWLGWFGFNAGSLLSAHQPSVLGTIVINTQLAGCSGLLVALFFSWIRYGKPDISMALNGGLAGLVAITAGSHVILPIEACFIGSIGGLIVLLGIPLLDRLRLDDPVGAIAVHGIAGVWGTVALGLFAGQNLVTEFGAKSAGLFHGGSPRLLAIQFTGVFCVAACTLAFSALILWALKSIMGIRVQAKAEIHGLDIEEFGVDSYNDFQIFSH
jgi:Amt family ammonium transporter